MISEALLSGVFAGLRAEKKEFLQQGFLTGHCTSCPWGHTVPIELNPPYTKININKIPPSLIKKAKRAFSYVPRSCWWWTFLI